MANAEGWDIQFAPPFDLSRAVSVLDLDPDNHNAEDIAAVKARGVKVLCYVSIGTAEDYRSDISAFPPEVLGKRWPDWPEERYLDIRAQDVLLPIMRARFQKCRDLGFDGIDPDNQDTHWSETGFALTEADTLSYVSALVGIAHGMGLQFGQKNNPDSLPALVGTLDYMVTENCGIDGWCDQALPYVKAGKPVYAIEYPQNDVEWQRACASAPKDIQMIRKDHLLSGAGLATCPSKAG